MRSRSALPGAICLMLLTASTPAAAALIDESCTAGTGPRLPHPVLFVTQVPIPADFATIGSTFANHEAGISTTGRGGDLYIRYEDGTLCNLTRQAGLGSASGFQGASAIAVRDPSVHWNARRALFSMAVGAPERQYEVTSHVWQIYEIIGLERGKRLRVRKVPHQPARYNNVSPIYAPDGRILFTSDRPRDGRRHLYPQLDEYESTPTVTGLWSLERGTGKLALLDHAPSGDFTPIVDSFGRVLFTRWDHLQRDQQADADADAMGYDNGTFDYADESAGAERLPRREEVFPEPRSEREDLLDGTNLNGLRFNHFFPWQINLDGTEAETLNHVGRHELHDYFDRVFNDDPGLDEFIDEVSGRVNPRSIESFFQIAEDPVRRGVYFGVDTPEFGTHASGRIVRTTAPPRRTADRMKVAYITDPAGADGHYREPLPLADGTLVAAHTFERRDAANEGSRAAPVPRYRFRLRKLVRDPSGGPWRPGAALTPGIERRVRYWDPDVLVTYDGPLWELSPVEVRPRTRPTPRTSRLPQPEAGIFADEGVGVAGFQRDLRRRGLALVVSRDVTTRDAADRQQPFNLKVAGSQTQTTGDGGILYEVAYLQFFQADQVRGLGGRESPSPGRRVLARPMHPPAATNPPAPQGPPGGVTLAADGSMAALVPARRAMSWQLTDAGGEPVVRERYWLTFQPGEIRVCASCHGVNTLDQAGAPPPDQPPEALRALLRHWKSHR